MDALGHVGGGAIGWTLPDKRSIQIHTQTYTQTHAQIDIQTDRHKYTHTRKHAHFRTQANIDVDDVGALVLAGHSRDKRSTQGLCLEAHPYSAIDPPSEAMTHTAGFSSKHTTVYHIPETEYNGPRRLSVVATVYLARLATTGPRVEGPGDQKRPCFPCIIVLPVCTLVLCSICNHHGFMYTYCIAGIIIRDYASSALRSPSEQNFLPTETIKWTHHEPYLVDVCMYHIVLSISI